MSDFARPWLVVLALGTPLLLGWLTAVRRRHQRVPALAVRRRPLLGGLAVASPILALCGLAAAWLAAAGPRRASFRSEPSAGRNFVVLLDASASMAEPSGGFEAARTAVERFIALRRADRVALVLFGRRAAVLAPLTHDHATLLALVHKLSPTALGNETAIGDGLAVALGLLDGTPRGSGAIVLVSDGRNNAGALDPRTAAQAAADHGVEVDTVGVAGAAESGAAPGLDEPLLRDLAVRTGGEYVRVEADATLSDAFERLSRLRPSAGQARADLVWQDHSGPLAAAAAVLLLAASLGELGSRRSWA